MTAINTAINVISKPKLNKEYKRVLTAGDSDYLQMDATFTQPDNSTVKFNINVLDDSSTIVLCSGGVASNYLALNVGALFLQAGGSNRNILASQVTNGLHEVAIRRGVGQNFGCIDGGVEEEFTGVSAALQIDDFSRFDGGAIYYNNEIYNFDLDGKIVSLNNGNGAAFSSDDGTITGTVETLHLNGLNHINLDIIKSV